MTQDHRNGMTQQECDDWRLTVLELPALEVQASACCLDWKVRPERSPGPAWRARAAELIGA